MLIRHRSAVAGFSLIELMIGLVVLGILFMVGLPSLATWMQNTQIRTSADTMSSGLNYARAEALRRNTNVRFQLVDSLNAGCALSATGRSWVVSLGDANGVCNEAISDTAGAMILQKKDAAEGAPNAAIEGNGRSVVIFNGLGRVNTTNPPLQQADISNPNGGACQAAGPMRCLSIRIQTGGQIRLCDPAVVDNTDPRACN